MLPAHRDLAGHGTTIFLGKAQELGMDVLGHASTAHVL